MNNLEPLVTIVVGAFKRPSVLAQTIESILSQTYRNFIFYIVEDNYPNDLEIVEETRKVISKFDDDRLIHIRNSTNIGVPFVYKKWLDLVKTKYYIIGGDGDMLENYAIQQYVDFLENHPRSSLVYGLEKNRKDTGEEYPSRYLDRESGEYSAFEYLQYKFIRGRQALGWGYVMYRSDFYKVKNIRVTNYHYWDHYFQCTYLLFTDKVGYINNNMAIRHIDPSASTWASTNPFLYHLERKVQSSKFIDEYETHLIQKGYPVNKYRLNNALHIFLKLGFVKKGSEFKLALRIAFIDFASVLSTGLIWLITLPLNKLFNIIIKSKLKVYIKRWISYTNY